MMRRLLLAWVPVFLLLFFPALAEDPRSDQDEPVDVGLVEKVERPLAQIHVTFSGPEKKLAELSRDDIVFSVRGTEIKDFTLDRFSSWTLDPSGSIAEDSAPRPGTYLFYFDQALLKPQGRQRAIHLARKLVSSLITGGNRGTIVSSGKELKVYAHPSPDPGQLLAALDRLEKDPEHQDVYAAGEENRIASLVEGSTEARVSAGLDAGVMERFFGSDESAPFDDMVRQRTQGGGLAKRGEQPVLTQGQQASLAQTLASEQQQEEGRQDSLVESNLLSVEGVARLYQRDELWRALRSLQRLRAVLTRLYGVEPPKSVLYFADIFRLNPGEHYLRLFEEDIPFPESSDYLDDLLNDAAADGIRFYAVQAEGLVAYRPGTGFNHIRDAQDALSSLALETGGQAFLNGVEASRISEAIVQDLANTYLLSFDPTGFPLDMALPVSVRAIERGIRVQHPGRLVLRSEAGRRTSRLLAAFAAPETTKSDLSIRPTLIPTGYQDGRFSALVQISVPGSGFPASTWDLGASIISRGKVRETSGRLTVSSPGAPVVLQQSMSFAPGPYEIVAVAHNLTIDVVASRQMEGAWPKPNAELAAVGPIAVVQPTRAAIRKEDQVKTSGALAFSENDPVRIDRPTALMAMICKSRDQKGSLQVERDLVGESAVAFPAMEMELGKESCALIQDLIPAGTMTPGAFSYRIRVLDDGTELARAERKFLTRKDTSTQEVPEDEAPGTGTARGS